MTFNEELDREFEEIKDYLPGPGCSILDIGCGLAGIDLKLYKHFERNAILHLLDKDGISEIYYGFNNEAAFYNKLALTKTFLIDNGVAEENINLYDARKSEFPCAKFDLIISLISWGFHYPIATYLDNVVPALKANGRLILDIRNGSDGYDALNRKFRTIRTIATDRKRVRVVATME